MQPRSSPRRVRVAGRSGDGRTLGLRPVPRRRARLGNVATALAGRARGNATAIAAVVSAVAAAAALIFTAEQSRVTQQQLLINEQGQFTDRYTRAIQQLGDPALDVRLGGIYGLERLAHDSPRDQPTIVAVLSAYLRDHARPGTGPCTTPPRPFRGIAHTLLATASPLPPVDVKGVIDVLGRRDRTADGGAVETLTGACLRYQLHGADFSDADLTDADLTNADLTRTLGLPLVFEPRGPR